MGSSSTGTGVSVGGSGVSVGAGVSVGGSIVLYDVLSVGAKSYLALANELIARAGGKKGKGAAAADTEAARAASAAAGE